MCLGWLHGLGFGSSDPGVFWSGGCLGDVAGIPFGLEFSLLQKLEERFSSVTAA